MTDRRQFLGCFGGLVATAMLPDGLQDGQKVFASRGNWERLSISYARIDAGASAPFSVLHISDTHLTATYDREPKVKQELKRIRTQTFGGRQEEALRDSLAWAKLNTDYVLHTGDLIDWQSEANFDLVRKYFGAIALGAMGNHEYSPSMWLGMEKETRDAAWREKSAAVLASAYPFDISFNAKAVNGVNFVMLDDVYGTVTAQQVVRFHAEVKKGLPIILCMHVPFFTDGLWLQASRFWRNYGKKFRFAAMPAPDGDLKRQREDRTTADFIAYLKGEKLLKGLLVGHEHINMEERFSPTAVQYCVGANFMFDAREILFT